MDQRVGDGCDGKAEEVHNEVELIRMLYYHH